MSSLSDFVKNFKPKKKPEREEYSQSEIRERVDQIKRENFSSKEAEVIENAIGENFDKYSNMDQGQLYNELFSEASRLKKSGKFNEEAIRNTIENMGAYLDPSQKSAMLELLEKLR